MEGRMRKESIRDTESVHFCEEVDCIEYTPSIRSEVTDEVNLDDIGDYDDEDGGTIVTSDFGDSDSNFRRRLSILRMMTWRERLGEHCVRCSCTALVGLALLLTVLIAVVAVAKIAIAIVFWRSCPITDDLPVYLLVSGLSPLLFYVTCRTRRKQQGKAPETQRIMGRWRFSAFPCTLDTEQSWQAGLAGVLSFFLLVWLIYGTVLVVMTSKNLEHKPHDCPFHVAVHRSHNNATSSQITSSSLISSRVRNSSIPSSVVDENQQRNDSMLSTEHSSSASSLSSSSPVSSLSSPVRSTAKGQSPSVSPTSLILTALLPLKTKNATKIGHSAHYSDVTASSDDINNGGSLPSDATDSTDVMRGPGVNDDVNVTSVDEEECRDCDGRFLTWCLALVLFDWLYMAALVVNVLVLGTVPCCCYVSVDA